MWVALVVVASVAAFALWIRQGMRQLRETASSVAAGVRQLRAMHAEPLRMTPFPGEPSTLPPEFPAITREIALVGLRTLGDVEERSTAGDVAGLLRWFASESGEVFGWFGVTEEGPAMLLISEGEGSGFVATLSSPHAPSTVVPGTVKESRLRWEAGLEAALTEHRSNCPTTIDLVRVETLEAGLSSLRRLKAHVADWRSKQDPEGLLEADVRSILGDDFDNLGDEVIDIVQLLEQQPPGVAF